MTTTKDAAVLDRHREAAYTTEALIDNELGAASNDAVIEHLAQLAANMEQAGREALLVELEAEVRWEPKMGGPSICLDPRLHKLIQRIRAAAGMDREGDRLIAALRVAEAELAFLDATTLKKAATSKEALIAALAAYRAAVEARR